MTATTSAQHNTAQLIAEFADREDLDQVVVTAMVSDEGEFAPVQVGSKVRAVASAVVATSRWHVVVVPEDSGGADPLKELLDRKELKAHPHMRDRLFDWTGDPSVPLKVVRASSVPSALEVVRFVVELGESAFHIQEVLRRHRHVGTCTDIDKQMKAASKRLESSGAGGYIVVMAQPRVGKTALIVSLYQHQSRAADGREVFSPVYFLERGPVEPEVAVCEMFESLINQLQLRYSFKAEEPNESGDSRIESARDRFEKALHQVHEKIESGTGFPPVRILIDGLDEVLRSAKSRSTALKRVFPSLPKSINVVITSRPGTDVAAFKGFNAEVIDLRSARRALSSRAPSNRVSGESDVTRFIERELRELLPPPESGQPEPQACEELDVTYDQIRNDRRLIDALARYSEGVPGTLTGIFPRIMSRHELHETVQLRSSLSVSDEESAARALLAEWHVTPDDDLDSTIRSDLASIELPSWRSLVEETGSILAKGSKIREEIEYSWPLLLHFLSLFDRPPLTFSQTRSLLNFPAEDADWKIIGSTTIGHLEMTLQRAQRHTPEIFEFSSHEDYEKLKNDLPLRFFHQGLCDYCRQLEEGEVTAVNLRKAIRHRIRQIQDDDDHEKPLLGLQSALPQLSTFTGDDWTSTALEREPAPARIWQGSLALGVVATAVWLIFNISSGERSLPGFSWLPLTTDATTTATATATRTPRPSRTATRASTLTPALSGTATPQATRTQPAVGQTPTATPGPLPTSTAVPATERPASPVPATEVQPTSVPNTQVPPTEPANTSVPATNAPQNTKVPTRSNPQSTLPPP